MMLVLGVLLSAVSLWIAQEAELSVLSRAIGVIGTVLFASLGVLVVIRFFDRGEQLRVSSDGIYYKQWSETVIPWDQIVGVTVWQYRRQRAIILHLTDPRRFPSTTVLGRLAGANRRLTGGDIAITLTPMDRGFDETLAVIEDYRATSAR